ncbi:MAG: anhydro-N-acetylmuramic acid kinase [Bacteroidetes bacterium]|nr:anhydro-N-acetylmuramic acid kinase [Bacteroidota bacterium]
MDSVYNVIGLMSGTSLDGLDIALCRFKKEVNKWSFEILKAETVAYTEKWIKLLSHANELTAYDFIALHNEYGYFIGKEVKRFITTNNLEVDFIASHGHTVFHQPAKKITFQIGNGDCIAAETGISVISDFRTMDVAMGGQGAPLVPIGDQYLFAAYDFCINLGGFANLSFEQDNKRIAYDICPFNLVLNQLSNKLGFPYDDKGLLASQGVVQQELLNELNALNFYKLNHPKSLGREWLISDFLPVLSKYNISIYDKIRTAAEHIVLQLIKACENKPDGSILFTGGGAYNNFIIKRFKSLTKHKILIPDKTVIDFKEALIFAFLGVLRFRNEINCLQSVTGASGDNIGGKISLLKNDKKTQV